MPDSLKCFDLSNGFRIGQGDPLQQFLKENSGMAVVINLSALRRIDTLVLQLLLVAARDWARRGLGFTLVGLTQDVDEALLQMGAREDLLKRGVTA